MLTVAVCLLDAWSELMRYHHIGVSRSLNYSAWSSSNHISSTIYQSTIYSTTLRNSHNRPSSVLCDPLPHTNVHISSCKCTYHFIDSSYFHLRLCNKYSGWGKHNRFPSLSSTINNYVLLYDQIQQTFNFTILSNASAVTSARSAASGVWNTALRTIQARSSDAVQGNRQVSKRR